MNLTVGSRVMCVNLPDMNGRLVGQTGTIIEGNTHSFGVRFDKFIDGHDCTNGNCEYGYGWYIEERYLIPIPNIR